MKLGGQREGAADHLRSLAKQGSAASAAARARKADDLAAALEQMRWMAPAHGI